MVQIGPKNTVRFQWEDAEFPVMERDHFAKDILLGLFELRREDVLCLQDNPRDKGYDVTFYKRRTIDRMNEVVNEKGLKDFPGLKIYILAPMGCRKVTVHMFNPHVTEEDISGFLTKYGCVIPEKTEKVMDRMGFWTGKREFLIMLNEDPQGHDGFVHPPAFFTIGRDRGYLSYFRQPPFCKKCRGSGHKEKDCGEGAKCRFCSSKEHGSRDCPRPKGCHACRSKDHLLKDCPRRGGAGGVRPGNGAETRRGEKDSLEAAAALPAVKDGARTVSQAFNGTGDGEATSGGKKVKKKGDTEEIMDSVNSGEERTGGAEAVTALSFSSRLPASLFGPFSPGSEEGGSPQWAGQEDEEGPT